MQVDEVNDYSFDVGTDGDDYFGRPMNATEVVNFLPLPSTLKYASPDTDFLSDIDGRETEAVFGTPGGDAGARQFLSVCDSGFSMTPTA